MFPDHVFGACCVSSIINIDIIYPILRILKIMLALATNSSIPATTTSTPITECNLALFSKDDILSALGNELPNIRTTARVTIEATTDKHLIVYIKRTLHNISLGMAVLLIHAVL
jgi:hypothetical protein